ncbi:SAM-dependent methyltransferase [Loktanella sp. SALINAS62]|nr:SAM-dependent methyltransferase [Loktanella sp. SALINAS62]
MGTFALRSPVRPNPIGSALVRLIRIDGSTLVVRGVDCLDDRIRQYRSISPVTETVEFWKISIAEPRLASG